MTSANKRVDKNKYIYVYYVATGELYEIAGMKSLGHYADIGGLVGYEVKSWKPSKVNRLLDNLVIDKNGSNVYLGMKI